MLLDHRSEQDLFREENIRNRFIIYHLIYIDIQILSDTILHRAIEVQLFF